MEVIKKRFYKSLAGFRGDFYLAAFVALTLLPLSIIIVRALRLVTCNFLFNMFGSSRDLLIYLSLVTVSFIFAFLKLKSPQKFSRAK
jgi:hypothetical protein